MYFGCSQSTIHRKLKRHSISYHPKKQTKKKIDVEALIKHKANNPDAKLKELAEPFGCSEQAVYRVLKMLNITHEPKDKYKKKIDPEELKNS